MGFKSEYGRAIAVPLAKKSGDVVDWFLLFALVGIIIFALKDVFKSWGTNRKIDEYTINPNGIITNTQNQIEKWNSKFEITEIFSPTETLKTVEKSSDQPVQIIISSCVSNHPIEFSPAIIDRVPKGS